MHCFITLIFKFGVKYRVFCSDPSECYLDSLLRINLGVVTGACLRVKQLHGSFVINIS